MEQTPAEGAKQSEIQRIVMDYLRGKVSSSRDFKNQTGVSHAMYGRWKDGDNAMGVDKLEQICARFPELKTMIGQYLTGNKMGKPTSVQEGSDNKEIQMNARETFYQDLIENNPDYNLVPKAIFKDYKIVPEQILNMITQSKDDLNKALEEKHLLIIQGYETKIERLEREKAELTKQNDDLQRQIPAKNE